LYDEHHRFVYYAINIQIASYDSGKKEKKIKQTSREISSFSIIKIGFFTSSFALNLRN